MTSSSLKWSNHIAELNQNKQLRSRTCKTYIKQKDKDICQCGRLKPSHSYTTLNQLVLAEKTDAEAAWNEFADSASTDVKVYGILSPNDAKFVRCDNRTKVESLYKLILNDCNNHPPTLLISVYGGAKYFTLSDRLEKDFLTGIIDLATRAEAWVLTAGVNNGVATLIGEGISQYQVLKQHPKPVTCIGLTQWGSLSEETRMQLKQASPNYPEELMSDNQTDADLKEDKEQLEPNHTHYLILDNGQLSGYLSDAPRAQFVTEATKSGNCYGVTIIVEGGVNTLEVVQADIHAKRPVVLIQKSGRISDVLANLVQVTTSTDRTKYRQPTDAEIKENLDKYFPTLKSEECNTRTKQIVDIMKDEHRNLIHVYQLDGEQNVSETIFQAIFSAYKDNNPDDEKRARLLDLSVRWDFIDGAKQLLEINNIKKEKDERTKDKALLGKLLKQALEHNRPSFVDYILRCGYDPRDLPSVISQKDVFITEQQMNTTPGLDKAVLCQRFIVDLYNHIRKHSHGHHNRESVNLFYGDKTNDLTSVKTLDRRLDKWLGSYMDPIYVSKKHRNSFIKKILPKPFNNKVTSDQEMVVVQVHASRSASVGPKDETNNSYSQQEMLRDLFLWSVFMDLSEMSKVILIHLKERICASLIAAKVFKSYSEEMLTVDAKDRLKQQVTEFEIYSEKCVDKCYEFDETVTCELLMRETSLFGNVTCMQVAIAGQNMKFLGTACFDYVLSQIWCNKLALSNNSFSSNLRLSCSIGTFGFLAPKALNYRPKEECKLHVKTENHQEQAVGMSPNGINYYIREDKPNYWKRFRIFHETPLVKMCYHFVSYIWFLLIFSHMMLYHFDSPAEASDHLHWTEILVIITVTTMFFEEIRQIIFDLHKKMLEKWGTTNLLTLTQLANPFYALPFLLFYLGILLRYAFGNTPSVLSAARIILAFDLELWFLRSLKFVIALKFLGPKLFMLRNMLRDLAAFVYLIFIAIAAYGVVSRALFMYNQVPFTGRGIFENVFYPPYWFIHGDINDTKTLDSIIHDANSTFIAEATATQVLLAFHMLFINILLLNLLIAVFANTIDQVENHSEVYWRFQRYSFVREYFERPWLPPPLLILIHIWLVLRALFSCVKRSVDYDSITAPIFKMIPLDRKISNEQWNKFENAATYGYARSIVSIDKKKDLQQQSKSAKSKTAEQMYEDMQKQLTDVTMLLKRLSETMPTTDKSALPQQ